MTGAPSGIDQVRVAAWLTGNTDLRAPLVFELITGGASNLTFKVTDARGSRVVLRRPPTGHVLASAHDMVREHRIISALFPTAVPVPKPLGLCTDEEVNSADFYVMDFVPGSIVFTKADGFDVDEALRSQITASLVDTLAALHAVDPDAVGLGDLGRKEDYSARQLRRWKRQVDEGSDRDMPLVHELHEQLAASAPEQQGAGIVHGDYRLDNCMMAADGSVAAVLDWELCTLGDVLADVAGLMMWWGDQSAAPGRFGDAPTTVPGFGTAEDVLDRYAALSERDLSMIPWYIAFQFWRLACITEGVRFRYVAGAMGDQHYDERAALDSIDYLLEMGRERLGQTG